MTTSSSSGSGSSGGSGGNFRGNSRPQSSGSSGPSNSGGPPRSPGGYGGGGGGFNRGPRFPRREGPPEAHRINSRITAREVRVISESGEQHGVLSINDALNLATREGLDLVEVAPQAKPPVCKIMDYGKFKYREQKKEAEAKKKRTESTIKEFRCLKDLTGSTPLDEVFRTEGTDEVERHKRRLIQALFQLQDTFCHENGWYSTRPNTQLLSV